MSKETIEQCEFFIYSKSLVDLYFYVGDSGGTVKSAVNKYLKTMTMMRKDKIMEWFVGSPSLRCRLEV